MQSDEQTRSHWPEKIEKTFTFTIPAGQKPTRLDVYLSEVIPNASRTRAQEAIDSGAALVNGKQVKPSRKLMPGDVVSCTVMKSPPLQLVPEDIPLDIVYEDDVLLVINKPAGMVVHPAFGNRYGTVVNAVLWHMGVREAQALEEVADTDAEGDDDFDDDVWQTREAELLTSDVVRPGIVHRLDKDTTGLMVICKDIRFHRHLSEQFATKTAGREYLALVWGDVQGESGTIEGDIGRSPRDRKKMAVVKKDGKPAVTDWSVEERFSGFTMMRLKLRTGRTHQIRVHCSHKGHPLFGDEHYGGTSMRVTKQTPGWRTAVEYRVAHFKRQALHAASLTVVHPLKKERMTFEAPLPEDMQTLLAALRELR